MRVAVFSFFMDPSTRLALWLKTPEFQAFFNIVNRRNGSPENFVCPSVARLRKFDPMSVMIRCIGLYLCCSVISFIMMVLSIILSMCKNSMHDVRQHRTTRMYVGFVELDLFPCMVNGTTSIDTVVNNPMALPLTRYEKWLFATLNGFSFEALQRGQLFIKFLTVTWAFWTNT